MDPDVAPAAPPAPSRAFRTWVAAVQTASFAVIAGLCLLARKFKPIYEQLEMNALPPPTSLCLAVSRVVLHPVGIVLTIASAAALGFLILRGTLDRSLRKVLVLNVLGITGLIVFYVLSVYLPIIQIQRELEKQPH